MKAKEIMAKNPRTVTPQTTVREAAKLMKDEDVGALPVVEAGGSRKLVGMVTDRDIAIRIVAEGKDGTSRVDEVMSGSPKTARENDDVERVLEVMSREQVRRVPIVDDREELVGIVAQADVARKDVNDKKVERTVEKISEPGGRHAN